MNQVITIIKKLCTKTVIFFMLLFWLGTGVSWAQFSIDELKIAQTENFEGFTGSGFTTSPTAGQLNSNAWRVTGMSDGDGAFGGTHPEGDFARGPSTGGETTGGTYSFDADLGTARVLGFQPIGSDFTPGTVTVRLQNNTSAVITELDISYDIYVYNDQDRANSFNFAHSDDGATYTGIRALDYTTPEAADTTPAWVQVNRSTTITGLSIGIGDFYYLQWQSDDVAGGGSRDEFGLTNLSVTADGTVVEDPTIVASPLSLTSFEYVQGSGPSDEQSFTASGTNLEGDITITPPTNYEVSTATGESFAATNPITLAESGGEVSETTIYVRLKSGLSTGSYSNENIQLTSTNADHVNVSTSGEVTEPFGLPYSNAFRSQDNYDSAIAEGFTVSDADQQTAAGGYLRVNGQGYLQSPTIDFTEYDYIETSFEMEPWGSGSNREFSVLLSNDDGASFDVIAPYQVPGSYTEFVTTLDLTSTYNVSEGRIQFKMTDGTGRTRFRDLEITEAYGTQLTSSAGFRMLSTPTTVSFTDLLDPIWTQGATVGADTPEGDPNVFIWSNSSTDGGASNWTGLTDLSPNITAGTGFLVYVFADDNYGGTPDGWPKTISVSGTENAADVTPTVNSNSNGFTMVGNPFAKTIDFNSVGKTELTNVAYVWDPNQGTGGAWKSYETAGSTGDLTDGLIKPFQGFFVQSASDATAPAITFGDVAKSTGGSFYGKQSNQTQHIVRLEMDNGSMSNSTWIRFSEEGSVNGQVVGDALQLQPLSSNYAQLATGKADKTLFDINHLPLTGEEITIPLHVSSTAGGTFTLRATDFELPEGFELIFNDHNTGESIAVTENFEYQIHLGAAKANSIPPLKQLTQEPMVAKASSEGTGYSFTAKAAMGTNVDDPYGQLPEQVTLSQNYPNPFNPTTTISYELPESSHVTLQVFDMLGRQVATLVDGQVSAGTNRAIFDAGNLSSGMYIYRLQAGDTVFTKKLTLIK